MGYYVENICSTEKYTPKNMWIVVVASIISIGLTCGMTHLKIQRIEILDVNEVESFFMCFISIPACSVYFIVKHISKIKSNMLEKIAVWGQYVFGVYLIEKILRALTTDIYALVEVYIGSFCASILQVFCVMLSGLIIIRIIKKIPFLSNVINKFV